MMCGYVAQMSIDPLENGGRNSMSYVDGEEDGAMGTTTPVNIMV